MKIFRYWKKESETVQFKGNSIPINARGGSNESFSEASARAFENIARLKRQLLQDEPENLETYESDILEEPLEFIDDDNIVTRNRYGARILNSRSTLFIDVDKPPLKKPNIFVRLFSKPMPEPEQLSAFFESLARRPECRGLALRVYSTCKGYRIIVHGRNFSSKEKAAQNLLNAAGSDMLYATLCFKQGCFRARLTPKPYRIKSPTIKLKYPRNQEEEPLVAKWVQLYEKASQGHAVCRLFGVFGEKLGSSDIIRYHDDATGVDSKCPLA